MHLVITSAEDATAHLIFDRVGSEALRLNWECWDQYSLTIASDDFKLADKFGRVVTNETLGNVLWRKPVAVVPKEEGERYFAFHEFKAAIEAVLARVRRESPQKLLVDPQRLSSVDRFYQLSVARAYLPTPEWVLTNYPSKHEWGTRPWVVKSVSSRPIPQAESSHVVLFTTAVDPYRLSDGWPWFIQELIDAPYDLTVVYVDGASFGFLLDRRCFDDLDWRTQIGTEIADHGWVHVELPPELTAAFDLIMRDLDLRFGRIDLLARDAQCQEVVFLEVNANGQWAWLDLDGRYGVVDAVVRFLTG